MASPRSGQAERSPMNVWLIVGLVALILIGIVVLVSNKKQAADPTLTAAPPLPQGQQPHVLAKDPQTQARFIEVLKATGQWPPKTAASTSEKP